MALSRILRHLCSGKSQVRRAFPNAALERIGNVIRESEATHHGEIRFAVEAGLDLAPLVRRQSTRARALEVFATLGVWDTEQNNGVLIYLLLADHEVEIIADRGISTRVGAAGWEQICREMEQLFRVQQFETGVLQGIASISRHLQQHYPKTGPARNELADAPVVL